MSDEIYNLIKNLSTVESMKSYSNILSEIKSGASDSQTASKTNDTNLEKNIRTIFTRNFGLGEYSDSNVKGRLYEAIEIECFPIEHNVGIQSQTWMEGQSDFIFENIKFNGRVKKDTDNSVEFKYEDNIVMLSAGKKTIVDESVIIKNDGGKILFNKLEFNKKRRLTKVRETVTFENFTFGQIGDMKRVDVFYNGKEINSLTPKLNKKLIFHKDDFTFKFNNATYEVDGLFKAKENVNFNSFLNENVELLYGELDNEIKEGEMVVLSVKNHFNARDDLSQMFSNLDDLFHLYEEKKMTMILVTKSKKKLFSKDSENLKSYFTQYDRMYDSISQKTNIIVLNLNSDFLFEQNLYAEHLKEEIYVTKKEFTDSLEKIGKEMNEIGKEMNEIKKDLNDRLDHIMEKLDNPKKGI